MVSAVLPRYQRGVSGLLMTRLQFTTGLLEEIEVGVSALTAT